jgi:DNA-binding transcriptional MerR regulator
MRTRSTDPELAPTTDDGPRFRSGTVARMAQMPVATLRIWEQRHRAVQPGTAASGHRLYAPADVQRVMRLRQLTGQGHAIGSIAHLDDAQLQRLLDEADLPTPPPRSRPGAQGAARPTPRVAVVGAALAARLQRPALLRQLTHSPYRLTVFESLTDVAKKGTPADLLLWHAPELQPAGRADLQATHLLDPSAALPADLAAALQACGAQAVAVVYRFAGAAATRALASAGAHALREPADDEALGAWLARLLTDLTPRGTAAPAQAQAQAQAQTRPGAPAGAVAPRRFDDAALTTIAGLSPTLACECPRHVAELLMQLSSFEAYSAGCIHRSAADAQLHAYLHQVAGTARALFETALERVARHEGLPLR